MTKLANKATINIMGINIYVGTFIFLVEIVGIRLTIRNETTHIKMLQNILERKTAYSGKSNEIIIGIIAKAAAAGAGTPTKNDANIPAEVHRQAWC